MPEIIDQANELAEHRLDVSAVLTVTRKRNYAVGIGGDVCG